MSASEKLKALTIYTDQGGDSGPYDINEFNRAYELLDVLPEILAVVDAAEKFQGYFPYSTANAELFRALAALEEKLAGP